MATAKPKVKRMMFGGAAKAAVGALGGVKKAVAAKATPMLQQAKQMQAAKSAAQQAAPKQMQFMSDKLRGAPMQKVNTSAPRGAIVPQKMTPQQARGAVEAYQKEQKLQQAANAISKPMQSVGSFGQTSSKLGSTISGAAARALGLGIKKGGVVKKKATKK